MPSRITLADVKASRIPWALGLCADDSRVIAFINEAQERLISKGLWYGVFGKFRICVDNSCITLPPQLATLESVAVCGTPVPVRDEWYEFLENGMGVRGAEGGCGCSSDSDASSSISGPGCCGDEALKRGYACTYKDIIPTGKKVNLVCDLVDDVGKEVLVLGYDDNGNWIRTDQGGTIKDGEIIVLAQGAGTNSTNFFSSVNDIQLPDDMDGQSWIYEYDNTAATRRLIGKYEYFETRPHYARYFLPGIRSQTCSDDECCQTAVDVIGKMEFIPVKVDTDYLIISCIPALKEMAVAISQAEKVPDPIAKNNIIISGTTMAIKELDDQLRHYRGSGVTTGITLVGSSIYNNDPVQTLL